ncbi:MAG: hypothetical protein DI551_02960 [Micavibrio aeruginosavorus]|uniref:SMP domain-containing protein n=1 Tax=Micavibrio aeruginosavorus TaxID=349221 RepID=A0A2W5PSE1_9BACT|nr:MAG: hypothetical protein DI551_02960 [Micavibrio aeruginosavorus]
MAVDDVKINTGFVPQATGNMSLAQMDEIERQAKAHTIEITTTQAKAEADATEVRGAAQGSANGKVYGDIALEAAGVKAITEIGEFLGTRLEDGKQAHGSPTGGKPQHIDDHIRTASRAPGLYRSEAAQAEYGGDPKKPNFPSATADYSGLGISTRASIASSSLAKQDSAGLYDPTPKTLSNMSTEGVGRKMQSVQLAQQQVASLKIANEAALESVRPAREIHYGAQYKAQQMAPGMDMSSGPKFRAQDFLKQAEEEKQLSAWRGTQT